MTLAQQQEQLVNDIKRLEMCLKDTTRGLIEAKERLLATQAKLKCTYKAGDRFTKAASGYSYGMPYILASLGKSQVNLISLQDGNRWAESMTVPLSHEIPKEDFEKHFGEEWRLVVVGTSTTGKDW